MKIAIDVGRVLIAIDPTRPNVFFTNEYLDAPPVPHSLDAVKFLVDTYTSANVYIISKSSDAIRTKRLAWLDYHGFYDTSRFLRPNVMFTTKTEEKDLLCRQYGIQAFVDDRFSVLLPMFHNSDMTKLYLFCPNENDRLQLSHTRCRKIKGVDSWIEIVEDLGLVWEHGSNMTSSK
eukprot:CAMPEP_0184706958 /NCGR_PEP_ID=MMETSP0313-20130426/37023_1 /TAXON_ID=2792 /ORGANISM="Porphyridium aerugineum, Strain SAG 1380-2" /LENGTH=175 /DNA_ID=CAMNT_0027168527 /DNA_START=932 /DNA_END=1459 /DNA_ORIENTATION=+